MTVAATSVKAYFEINVEGITQKQRKKIYRALFASPKPMTAKELAIKVNIDASTVAGRLNEMDEDTVERCDKRKCKESGRTAGTWRTK